MKNVQDIVNAGQCIGCGACFAICDHGHIGYKADGGMGFPVPQAVNCDDCGRCLGVCPSAELYKGKSSNNNRNHY